MYKDEYVFPAIIEETAGGSYSVYYPDLPGCISGGDTLEAAVGNAREALMLHLYGMEADNDTVPVPSKLKDIAHAPNDSCVLVDVNMMIYRKRRHDRYVNRVVSLPDWINAEAKRSGINVSQLLQEALKTKLGLKA
jgi:predicted RNase H-like HicB family nuclease